MRFYTPLHGDKRVVRKFLFIPVNIANDRRWLEWAMIEQIYIVQVADDLGPSMSYWQNIRFIE